MELATQSHPAASSGSRDRSGVPCIFRYDVGDDVADGSSRVDQ